MSTQYTIPYCLFNTFEITSAGHRGSTSSDFFMMTTIYMQLFT